MTHTWQEISKAKKAQVLTQIPKEWILDSIPTPEEVPNSIPFVESKLTKEEIAITNSTILDLISLIKAKKLSALEITKAFCHRTALLHQLTNCCTEIFFDKALARAKNQDDYYAKTGKLIGPLHGIPISAKDQINIPGYDSAMGFVGLVNKPIPEDKKSKIAIVIEDQLGGIFFVKTNVPPALMSFTTVNNIYGETVNVHNRNVSCGGSSGGEGALIGGRGALLGFGTDIGGSIRVPSSFGGIYGLRGSTNRLPYCNLTNSFPDQPVLSSVVGPMAIDLQDLKFVTKLIIDAEPWKLDPKVIPLAWREIKPTKKPLTFAIQYWNGTIHTSPPVTRAIETVVEKLKAQGHEVIEWKPPISSLECAKIAVDIYGADGYKEIVDYCALSGEPIVPEILSIAGDSDLPKGVSHIHEHWDHAKRRYEAQQKVDNYWFHETKKLTGDGEPVDGIICPVWDTPSFKTPDVVKFNGDYTAQFNVLDYSIVVVPVLKADKFIDKKDLSKINFTNEQDNSINEYYDEELLDGCPVGVQVVAPRWQEETAISLAEVVSNALKN